MTKKEIKAMKAEAVAKAIKEEREAAAKSYEDTVEFERRISAAYHAGANSRRGPDDYDGAAESPSARNVTWGPPPSSSSSSELKYDRETGRFSRG